MARMNISVPDTLYEKMKAFDHLNWSSVAARAFEAQIKMEKSKEVSMEEASFERLRASRDQVGASNEAAGVVAGKVWALRHATYADLERVISLDLSNVDDPSQAAYLVGAAILGEKPLNERLLGEHMFEVLGRQKPSVAEINGFIAGAIEVYANV